MCGEHLVGRLPFLDQFCHTVPNHQNHVPLRGHGRSVNGGSVTWDNFGIRAGKTNQGAESIKHSIERAAIGTVDVWVSHGAIKVSRHNHIRITKQHHRVPIGVRPRYRDQIHFLTVQMEFYRSVIRHHGKSTLRSRYTRRAVCPWGRMDHPLPQFLARQDRCTQLGEVFVSARVIRVYVRINHKSNRRGRNLLDRGDDFAGQRSKFRVHDEHTVRTREHANRAALSLERVEIVSELRRFDLDLAEVSRRRSGCGGGTLALDIY